MTEVKTEEKRDDKIRVNMNRRWSTFLNDANEKLKTDSKVTLRALGTAVNSLFTIDLKDEDDKSNPKLGCEITLTKGTDFEAKLAAYTKSVEDAREQRRENRETKVEPKE